MKHFILSKHSPIHCIFDFASEHVNNGHISTIPTTTSTFFITLKSTPIPLFSSSSIPNHFLNMPKKESFVFSHYFPFSTLLLILTLSPFCDGGSGGIPPHELWCVAKNNAEDSALQDALNWACGPGGADCGPIQQGGPCYDASNVQNTASYAFNDYFRKHGLTHDSCNFNNYAAITTLNPSHDNCKFPSSVAAVSNGSFSGSVPMAGLGPADNMNENGCSKISWSWWFWPLSIISHLLLMVSA